MEFNDQSDNPQGVPPKSRDELRAEIANDLRTNGKYVSFFERFNSATVDPFIEYYAGFKADLILEGKGFLKREEQEVIGRRERGIKYLWQIQQKKLFDLQCRWRADLITLPDVHTTSDFIYWSALIQRCPFIPTITADEFAAYHDYVMSDYFNTDEVHQVPWQEHWWLRNWDEDESEIAVPPGWYLYCEERLGWNEWRQLPDIRGKKEQVYLSLARGQRIASQAGKPVDKRPFLHTFDHEQTEAFVRAFEGPELLRRLEAKNRLKDSDAEDPELDRAVRILRNSDEPVPMEHNDNWRDGILHAALTAERLYVAKGCEQAYGEYLRREELKLGHELMISESRIERIEEHRNLFVEELLKGKVLNNEPPELDY